jgi:hypothetical protein
MDRWNNSYRIQQKSPENYRFLCHIAYHKSRQGVTWNRNCSSEMRSRRITAWAMTQLRLQIVYNFFFFFNNFSVCDKTEGTSRDCIYNKGFVHAICEYEGQTAMQTLKITRLKISMCSLLFVSYPARSWSNLQVRPCAWDQRRAFPPHFAVSRKLASL